MSEAPSPESGECEVGEDSLSTIDGESNVGSSVSKFASESEDESSSDSDEEEAKPELKYERQDHLALWQKARVSGSSATSLSTWSETGRPTCTRYLINSLYSSVL